MMPFLSWALPSLLSHSQSLLLLGQLLLLEGLLLLLTELLSLSRVNLFPCNPVSGLVTNKILYSFIMSGVLESTK